MRQSHVLVQAAGRGITVSSGPDDPPYEFQKGDIGVLQWQGHMKEFTFFKPFVIWKGDLAKRPRAILLSSVEFIGIETASESLRLEVTLTPK